MGRFACAAAAAFALALTGGATGSAEQPASTDCVTVIHTPPGTKKFVPPVKGRAEIGFLAPKTKVDGKELTTTIRVKNMTLGSIALLRVDEYWWDKKDTAVGGNTCRYRKPFMPGEIIEVTLKTIRRPDFARSNYQFSHANGEIKATVMKTLDPKPGTSE